MSLGVAPKAYTENVRATEDPAALSPGTGQSGETRAEPIHRNSGQGLQEPSHLDLYVFDVIRSESVVVAAQIPAAPILTSPTVAAVQYQAPVQGGQLTEAEAISVLQAAGWPTELIPQALAVAWCESKWSPAASGDSGHSRGWFQLNTMWFGYAGEDPAMWADPLVNARVAWRTYNYDISRGQRPWQQWSCKP